MPPRSTMKMLNIEYCFILAAVIVAFAVPTFASNFFAGVERHFLRIARRQGWAVLVVGLTALGLRAALLPLFPIPQPIVHDEFGYLLAADTYAHGRLTNPPHPMGVHFETFSVMQRPTYQCFAQPAQGMILAAGKVDRRTPFLGGLVQRWHHVYGHLLDVARLVAGGLGDAGRVARRSALRSDHLLG